MSEETVLTIKNLEKSYHGFQLGPVNLTIESGYIYSIMGQNGSGKSTLFKLLNGIAQPDKGLIQWLNGSFSPSGMKVKQSVAYVPDELDIPDEGWSLHDWMKFVSALYPGWNGRKYRQLIERYGMDENKPMKKASKGTRRKAALIIALAQEPQILLLDEPSAGLDPFAWRMMMEDLSEFAAPGDRTIIMATHIMEEIRRLGDYVIFLQDGQMFGAYEKDALIDEWKMLWVDRLPSSANTLPGVVHVEGQLPVRLVTNSSLETEAALEELGIAVVDKKSLEIDELFWHVVRMKDKSLNRRES
jgi:ABC-2 type transport system ATP-binding protein